MLFSCYIVVFIPLWKIYYCVIALLLVFILFFLFALFVFAEILREAWTFLVRLEIILADLFGCFFGKRLSLMNTFCCKGLDAFLNRQARLLCILLSKDLTEFEAQIYLRQKMACNSYDLCLEYLALVVIKFLNVFKESRISRGLYFKKTVSQRIILIASFRLVQ